MQPLPGPKSDLGFESDFRINLDMGICRITPKIYLTHSLVGKSFRKVL